MWSSLVPEEVGKHGLQVVLYLFQELNHQVTLDGIQGRWRTEDVFQEAHQHVLREEERPNDEEPNKHCGNLEGERESEGERWEREGK